MAHHGLTKQTSKGARAAYPPPPPPTPTSRCIPVCPVCPACPVGLVWTARRSCAEPPTRTHICTATTAPLTMKLLHVLAACQRSSPAASRRRRAPASRLSHRVLLLLCGFAALACRVAAQGPERGTWGGNRHPWMLGGGLAFVKAIFACGYLWPPVCSQHPEQQPQRNSRGSGGSGGQG
jgi:hypothetical protein